MSVYFDYKVQNPDAGSITLNLEWHPLYTILAVSSFGEGKGGYICIYDELGELIPDVVFPQHPSAQVTSIAWHPTRKVLVAGWETGELEIWSSGEPEFAKVLSPHQAPIIILKWSDAGGRLVSGDTVGALVGWKLDSRSQLLSVFHIELKDPLGHIVFRKEPRTHPGVDITGLAKAAVAGDEHALDLFSAWRPRTAGNKIGLQPSHPDHLCFYVASYSGKLFYFNEEGSCSEVLSTDGLVIKQLLFHETQSQLVMLTDGLKVGHFSIESNGKLSELLKMKLSGRPQDSCIAWASPGLLAISTGDLTVRCWDLESGDTYVLEASLTTDNDPGMPTEIITSLAYCSQRKLLCAGTNLGHIAIWHKSSEDSDGWVQHRGSQIRGAIKQLAWGDVLLAVNTVSAVYILREQKLCSAFRDMMSVVQLSPSLLRLQSHITEKQNFLELKVDLQVQGVTVTQKYLAVWSIKSVVVYQLTLDADDNISTKVIGTFLCDVENCELYLENLIVLSTSSKLELRTLQGTIKQNLSFPAEEGSPITISLCGSFIVVSTSVGYVKLWDLSRREAKPHGQSCCIDEKLDDFGEVMFASCNCDGSRVSMTVAKSDFFPDPRIFVWDSESDTLSSYNCETGKYDEAGTEFEAKSSCVNESENDTSVSSVNSRMVVRHFWDNEDPRLLVCEAKRLPSSKESVLKRRPSSTTVTMAATDQNDAELLLVTFFCTPTSGLILHDSLPLSDQFCGLLGVQCPYLVVLRGPQCQKGESPAELLLMHDFNGLGSCEKPVRDAVLSFSYFLSIGNMDEAFKSIKTVHSEAIWSNLARMCVKTKRLDVAWVCLGHMGHGRAALTLRQASQEPELEARVGILALQLGLNDDAAQLFTQCGRFDLLNRLYRCSGSWDKAISVAEQNDRIHLRNTRHKYALHLQERGDTNAAIQAFEKAETHRNLVPRMLVDAPRALESYILRDRDQQLLRWWAQYLESVGQMDEALEFYREGRDYYSLVRVLCFRGDMEQAKEVAQSAGDKAACYHLARQLESQGQVVQAVTFFARAHAYSNAVRICRERNMDDQLWTLSLLAGPRDQLEAARHFEKSNVPDKAVLLYHRAGMLHQALNLAFSTQQYNALQYIAVDLNANSDPELVQKCAQFFFENKQYDKAVDLLATSKQHLEALRLCMEHNVAVTEELADKLTLAKGEANEETRVHILEKVAECAMSQGNYHLATKKFLLSGSMVKAMKALLKSGDTERIVYFANTSRQKEIYVMAANYLQSLDWQSDPEVLKNIVSFYSKGRAFDLLANFYVACAQVEVDEYQNYEKALGALGEANRCLAKAQNMQDLDVHQRAVENLAERTALVKKFVDIRRLFVRGDGDSAESQCRQLLQILDSVPSSEDSIVRRGDILAAMIVNRTSHQDFKGAQQLIDELRHTETNVQFYLSSSTLEKVSRGLGQPLTQLLPQNSAAEEEVAEEVEEDVRPGTAAVRNGRAYAV